MMKYYSLNDGERYIQAGNNASLVTQLRQQSSWGINQTDSDFMQDCAYWAKADGQEVRTDNIDNFVADMIKRKAITPISKKEYDKFRKDVI
jgi:hypothetical protein